MSIKEITSHNVSSPPDRLLSEGDSLILKSQDIDDHKVAFEDHLTSCKTEPNPKFFPDLALTQTKSPLLSPKTLAEVVEEEASKRGNAPGFLVPKGSNPQYPYPLFGHFISFQGEGSHNNQVSDLESGVPRAHSFSPSKDHHVQTINHLPTMHRKGNGLGNSSEITEFDLSSGYYGTTFKKLIFQPERKRGSEKPDKQPHGSSSRPRILIEEASDNKLKLTQSEPLGEVPSPGLKKVAHIETEEADSPNSKFWSKARHKAKLISLVKNERGSASLLRRKYELTKEASFKALEIIQDKAFVNESSFKPLKKSVVNKHEGGPRLLSILKKYANNNNNEEEEDNDEAGNRFYAAIAQLRKMNMGRLKKTKHYFLDFLRSFKKRTETLRSWVQYIVRPLKPEEPLKLGWDSLIMLMIIIDLVVLPFRICFDNVLDGSNEFLDTYDTIQTIFFLIDIGLNFHTAYYLDGNLVEDRRSIVLRYIRLWFWIDMVSSFPFEWVSNLIQEEESKQTQFLQIVKLLRFLKLIRVIRVLKLKRMLGKLQNFIYTNPLLNGVLSLIKLCMIISFLAHWIACGWHYIGSFDDGASWIQHNELDLASAKDRYIASLYFAITTMLTVGYGDIIPMNSDERLYAVFIMLIGGGMFGYTMNSIATIVHSLEDEKAKVRKKISIVARFMQKRGLARDVQLEVKKYLEFIFEDQDAINETEKTMFNNLSSDLRDKVYEQLNGRLLYENKVLSTNFSKKALYQVAGKIQEKTFSPGEVIADSRDQNHFIYYISKGQVGLCISKHQPANFTFKKEDSFGEPSFFASIYTAFIVKSIGFSHLLFLSREKFLESLEEFPQDKEMYCVIRDKVLIYEKFSVLQVACKVCNNTEHLTDHCPQLQYLPNKEGVINEHLDEIKREMESFSRRGRLRFSARMNLERLETKAAQIVDMYPLEVLDIKGETDLREEEEPDYISMKKRSSFMSPMIPNYASGELPKLLRSVSSYFDQEPRIMSRRRTVIRPTTRGYEIVVEPEVDLDRKRSMDEESGSGRPFEDFELDQVRNFQVYFPHNNVTKIAERIKMKDKVIRKGTEDIRKLKTRLKRVFKKIEKDKEKTKSLTRILTNSKKLDEPNKVEVVITL